MSSQDSPDFFLVREDSRFIRNKKGKLVNRRMSEQAKKNKNLVKAGYKTTPGKFTLFKKKSKSPRSPRSSRRESGTRN